MKKIQLLFLTILLITFMSINAFANNANLTWSSPTTRTDGTNFSLTEVKGYTVYYGITSSFGTSLWLPITTQWPSLANMSYSLTSLSTGTYYFSITCTDIYNQESGKAPTQIKYITPAPPSTPTNLTIITGLGVY